MRHCLGTKEEVCSTKLAIGSCIKPFSESIREEVETSLQRLGIDYIDIYMTHWQSGAAILRR